MYILYALPKTVQNMTISLARERALKNTDLDLHITVNPKFYVPTTDRATEGAKLTTTVDSSAPLNDTLKTNHTRQPVEEVQPQEPEDAAPTVNPETVVSPMKNPTEVAQTQDARKEPPTQYKERPTNVFLRISTCEHIIGTHQSSSIKKWMKFCSLESLSSSSKNRQCLLEEVRQMVQGKRQAPLSFIRYS